MQILRSRTEVCFEESVCAALHCPWTPSHNLVCDIPFAHKVALGIVQESVIMYMPTLAVSTASGLLRLFDMVSAMSMPGSLTHWPRFDLTCSPDMHFLIFKLEHR